MKLSLQKYLLNKREKKQKLLSLFLTAGFPQLDATLPLLKLLGEAGADLIELGIPFSDPLADGPTIQRTSQIALQNGVTVKKILEMAAAVKSTLHPPLILMGYYNPILQVGPKKFVQAAANAGVQGLIIPDLPPEESRPLRDAALAEDVSLIYLVSPNTSSQRLALIDELTTSFIYAVSVTGVTGARENVANQAIAFLQKLRGQVQNPVLVGFGVANAAEARRLAVFCDGVIVGSALLAQIEKHGLSPDGVKKIREFIRELHCGLD
ncbi:MAG: tryptophan synthase subunit alpha [candidate division KSB1 bacterium]|nr:tryptophan synthase subunit alpha [candidate division KSB1 bacterium]MDZ7366354.1 tryptophan synthase subunit alpha [candidate division KSB1 bacterium]MDZ7404009.1 tryptophan synthase subunit alpha [candidate division KSB1 bacterium]